MGNVTVTVRRLYADIIITDTGIQVGGFLHDSYTPDEVIAREVLETCWRCAGRVDMECELGLCDGCVATLRSER